MISDTNSSNDDSLLFPDSEQKPDTLDLIFAEEPPADNSSMPLSHENWKILIVDDDIEIHNLTRLVLEGYTFDNKGLEILSAYSAEDAKDVLESESEIALILLDVVMETDSAGLDLVQFIRNKLKNHGVRIILRTGQPGQAPEIEVIKKYDINDYKAKTELTAQKMFTAVTSSIRSYRHIQTIDRNRRGLEKIISASKNLYKYQSFRKFATGILTQLTSLLQLDDTSIYLKGSSLSALQNDNDRSFNILAGTGEFSDDIDKPLDKVVPEHVLNHLREAIREQQSIFSANSYTGYFESNKGEHNLLYLQWERPLTNLDRDLITIFGSNVAIAFDNISLNQELQSTQKEVIYTLSEVIEGKSRETANHIRRVAEISYIVANELKLTEHESELIKLAAPMHDIGKIGTPDSILKKPGKLTEAEYEIMKEHATIGFNIFKNSPREMMQAAGIIAHEHHEKWNGRGYPRGLQGEEIHIYGRIVALADVVDALANKRCYKPAWELSEIIDLLMNEKGEQFDPSVVDAFLNRIEDYKEIQERLKDIEPLDEECKSSCPIAFEHYCKKYDEE